MSEDTIDTAEAQHLLPGQRVRDLEEDNKHLRVVARTPHAAGDARIAAIGKSVAEVNPQYPEDAPVLVCVYESTLEERFEDDWHTWHGSYLAFMVGNHGLQTYSFPEDRLEFDPADTDADGQEVSADD